jgi:serine/threonine protein kinase
VLFALRTGSYPFVTAGEIKTKPSPDDKQARELLDRKIEGRTREADAEQRLAARVKDNFPSEASEILRSMLRFDPQRRPSARELVNRWEDLLRVWTKPEKPVTRSIVEGVADLQVENAKDLVAYLNAYLLGKAGMSPLQWDRVSKNIEDLEKAEATIGPDLIQSLKVLREKANTLRAAELVGEPG